MNKILQDNEGNLYETAVSYTTVLKVDNYRYPNNDNTREYIVTESTAKILQLIDEGLGSKSGVILPGVEGKHIYLTYSFLAHSNFEFETTTSIKILDNDIKSEY